MSLRLSLSAALLALSVGFSHAHAFQHNCPVRSLIGSLVAGVVEEPLSALDPLLPSEGPLTLQQFESIVEVLDARGRRCTLRLPTSHSYEPGSELTLRRIDDNYYLDHLSGNETGRVLLLSSLLRQRIVSLEPRQLALQAYVEAAQQYQQGFEISALGAGSDVAAASEDLSALDLECLPVLRAATDPVLNSKSCFYAGFDDRKPPTNPVQWNFLNPKKGKYPTGIFLVKPKKKKLPGGWRRNAPVGSDPPDLGNASGVSIALVDSGVEYNRDGDKQSVKISALDQSVFVPKDELLDKDSNVLKMDFVPAANAYDEDGDDSDPQDTGPWIESDQVASCDNDKKDPKQC